MLPEKPATDIYTFAKLRSCGFTYVDKTAMILPLVDLSIGSQFFLARPRRFGKSLLVSTMQCLFEGRRELFKGLAIEPRWDWSRSWPVLHLDMGSCQGDTVAAVAAGVRTLLEREAARFGLKLRGAEVSAQFQFLVDDLAGQSLDGQVVLLVDEYDKPLLGHLGEPGVNAYRDLLKSFYSVIKTLEGKLRFTFVTGVSKFAKVSIFSDLNNLKDRTMSPKEATLLGYTHEEVRRTYPRLIAALGEKHGLDFEATFRLLVGKYNGYRFEEHAESVMNPVSLGCCLEERKFGDYWARTAVPTFLIDALRRHPLNLQAVALEAGDLDVYEPARPRVETLLFQTGYLTIKSSRTVGAKVASGEPGWTVYELGFPNREVERSFIHDLVPAYVGMDDLACGNAQRMAGEALLENDVPRFFEALKSFFCSIPYSLTDRQNEQMWQAIVWTVLKGVGLYAGGEIQTATGRIDMVVDTPGRIFILEFKLDDSAANAIAQIEANGYAAPYALSQKAITLLGIGFSSEKRTIVDTLSRPLNNPN